MNFRMLAYPQFGWCLVTSSHCMIEGGLRWKHRFDPVRDLAVSRIGSEKESKQICRLDLVGPF